MKILVACEESQAVTIELRKLGHEAYSCDIEPCSGGHPEWHLQVDALELLKIRWDMIIAFPPCTYLSNAGAKHLFRGGKLNQERYEKGLEAKAFFLNFYNADCSINSSGKPSFQQNLRNAAAYSGNTALAIWTSCTEKNTAMAERITAA